jgi:hypothetical protein
MVFISFSLYALLMNGIKGVLYSLAFWSNLNVPKDR